MSATDPNDRREIPSTWSRPAEVVSTAPPRPKTARASSAPLPSRRRPFPVAVILGVGVIASVAATLAFMPRTQRPAPIASPVVPVNAVTPVVVDARPADKPVELPLPVTTPAVTAPEEEDIPVVIDELPVRKKARVLNERAVASLRTSDFASAEPLLARAVMIDPALPEAWRHLGIARAQLGDREGARRAYRRYLELAPKAPDAAQVRAILGQ